MGGADLRRNGDDGVKGVQTHWGEASVFKSPRRFRNNGHAGRSDMSSGERHTNSEQGVHAVTREESLTPLWFMRGNWQKKKVVGSMLLM